MNITPSNSVQNAFFTDDGKISKFLATDGRWWVFQKYRRSPCKLGPHSDEVINFSENNVLYDKEGNLFYIMDMERRDAWVAGELVNITLYSINGIAVVRYDELGGILATNEDFLEEE